MIAMRAAASAPPRVLIYGAGHIGTLATKLAVARGWRIAGAINRPGEKIGQDIGTLAGLSAPLSVTIAPPEAVDLRSLNAGVALVAVGDRLAHMLPIYRHIMEHGLSVISCDCEAAYPWGVDAMLAGEIDRIAKANGVTFTGTGLSDAYRVWVPRVLVGACDRLERFHHTSVVDVGKHGAQSCRIAHVGLDEQALRDMAAAGGAREVSIYRLILQHTVVSIGLTIHAMRETLEPVIATAATRCAPLGIVVPPGGCIGARFITEIDTKEGVRATAANELRLLAPGEAERMIFVVEGSSPLKIEVTGFDSDVATATQMIARVPDVLAAPPGIVTIDTLGPPAPCGQAAPLTPGD